MPNSGSKKTIQINHEFFKIGKKGLNAASSNHTQKKERKSANKTLKHNTIKKELIKRIQQLKQQEKEAAERERKTSLPALDETESEFSESMKYLQSLAQNKKAEQKKQRNAHRQQRKKTTGGSSSHNKTLKTSHLYRDFATDYSNDNMQVNVDVPRELGLDISPMQYTVPNKELDTKPAISVNTTIPPDPQSFGAMSHLYKKETERTPSIPSQTSVNSTAPQQITPLKHSVAPPYSNLKGSTSKPSFREWNRTRKNRQSPSIKTDNTSQLSSRERRLEDIKNRIQGTKSKPPEIMELKKFYTKSKDDNTTGGRKKKTIKRTIKHKYTVGKSKIKRRVSVLVKNLKTRKRIQEAKKELKKTDLLEIKRYLKEHGILKSGSSAPNDVLRAMYESAMLAGDVTNINANTRLHNYLEDDEN